MMRLLLLTWVLFSIPLSVGLGRLYRNASGHRRTSAWDPGDVAQMLTRKGYHQHG